MMNSEKDIHNRENSSVFPALMTVDEMAKQLRIGRSGAYMLVKSGQVRSIRIGRTIRIPRNAVIEFIGEP